MTDQRPIDVSTLRDGEFQAGWDACLSAIKEQFGEDYSSTNRNPEWHVKMPDPVCPFPMGARVVDPFGAVEIVTDWRPTPGGLWLVYLGGRAAPYGWLPDALTLAPEPAPIEVGDWWADEEGVPHVVEVLHDDSVGLRRWTASVVNRFVEPSLLRDYWTRLDGPPEPPEGSVGTVGPVVFEVTADGVEITGSAFVEPWPAFDKRYGTWLATLRILGSVD